MSMLFITHDLALVGEIADQVIVMRHGEIREQGPVREVLDRPQDMYTKALLHSRPQLSLLPLRLPLISYFMIYDGSFWLEDIRLNTQLPQRSRGLKGGEEIILDVRDLKKSFYSRKGLFGKDEFQAVKGVSFQLAKGKTLGLVGESGSGKTT